MSVLEKLNAYVVDMEVEKAVELTQKGLDEGKDAEDIMNSALIRAMDVVGEQYDKGEKYVPEMLLSAHAMKGAMEKLRPPFDGVRGGTKREGGYRRSGGRFA